MGEGGPVAAQAAGAAISAPGKGAGKSGGKFAALDLARTIAIVLAIFSHAFHRFNGYDHPELLNWPMQLVMRFAAPTFIVLFGALLEIVYVRRARQAGLGNTSVRLFQRALQCYLLYVIAVVILFLSGQSSPVYSLSTILMMGATHYSDILKYYAITFLLAPMLLHIRLRWGYAPLVIGILVIQAAFPLIQQIPLPPDVFDRPFLLRLSTFTIGVGTLIAGPSVLQGSFLVVTGMLIGNILTGTRAESAPARRRAYGRMIGLIALLAAAMAILAWTCQPVVSIPHLAGMTLRNMNHPMFFATGSFGAAVLISMFSLYRGSQHPTSPWRLTMLGERSLFTFSFGNSLISVAPQFDGTVPQILAASVALAVLVYLCSAAYDKLIRPETLESEHAVLRIASRIVHLLVDPLNARLMVLARNLLLCLYGSRLGIVNPVGSKAPRLPAAAATGGL